jgi:hypothetical protein
MRGYSDLISTRQYQNAVAGVRFAYERGYAINLSVDINWSRTEASDDPRGAILDGMMIGARKWLRRNGVIVFAQVEVRECPGDPTPIPNAHVMLHCPDALIPDFKRYYRGALRRRTGSLHAQALKFTAIGRGNPTLEAALGKLRYLGKGIDPHAAEKHHIRHESQGRVFGKRVSLSQDIGPSARRKHAAALTLSAAIMPEIAHAA